MEIDDKGRPRLAGLDRAALNEHADPRVDVRALAAVLFAMLTGVVHESASARLPALPAFVSPAPLGLATLLDRASDPEPSRRPADADAFLASLASIDLPRQPIPEQLAEVGSAARASTSPIWLAGLSMALLAIAALVAFILLAGRQ